MKIVCLMPTYGRTKRLLQNSLACFQAQNHEEKLLIIYDDLGTLNNTKRVADNIYIMTTPHRSRSVGHKYNVMVDFASIMIPDFEAVAVWDDDDVYLPNYLATHSLSLQEKRWSKPSTIISAYHDPPAFELSSGRFHGSIAIHRNLLVACGGWIDTVRATFDQEMLAKLNSYTSSSDPGGDPQYIYRWQTSKAGHCSGGMGREDWYAKYQPDSIEPIDTLIPEFDDDSKRLYESFSPNYLQQMF